MPDTTSSSRTDKRRAILHAALARFAETGFEGTTVPAIAKAAGVGTGTLYRYFESKEAIVNALYREHKQALSGRILAQIHPEQPAREQFHVYWRGMVEFARHEPQAFKFLELHHHRPYLDDASRALETSIWGLARQFFEHFRAEQVVKDVDADVLLALVHGAFVGMIRAADEGHLTLTPDAIDTAEQCVWEAIRR